MSKVRPIYNQVVVPKLYRTQQDMPSVCSTQAQPVTISAATTVHFHPPAELFHVSLLGAFGPKRAIDIMKLPFTLLDGSMGLELKNRKAAGSDVAYSLELFSTATLRETPHAIAQLHEDYINAGATVITTASYAVTRFYLNKVGEASRVKELNQLSVALARKAIAATASASRVSLAGCIPPLSESYRADLVPDDEQLTEEYAEIVDSLHGSDLFLCETMSSMREAAVCVPMCVATGKPTWASFTLKHDKDDRLCLPDGTDVEMAVKETVAMGVEAVLFNCCPPELIAEALPMASATLNNVNPLVRLGGYGNAWHECDRDNWTIDQNESHMGSNDHGVHGMVVRDLGEDHYVEHVQEWLQSGASIVGGCCGISPSHIQAISKLQSLSAPMCDEGLDAVRGISSPQQVSAVCH